jgi:hypothetical protein
VLSAAEASARAGVRVEIRDYVAALMRPRERGVVGAFLHSLRCRYA